MGGSGSSSKRKSSKTKRDKISSKKKKRISRRESKKSRRDYDSVSSYSDDDSVNSDHSSPSASEFTHRRKMNRNKKRRRDRSVSSYSDSSNSDSLSTYGSSHSKRRKARKSRIELKSRKKKSRKSSSNHPEKDAHKLRKRKKSGRDGVGKPRRKSSKKKSRKHLSSSSGSDSESCSTGSGGTADGKRKRSKVFSDEESEKLRAKRKRKARSPSCSSYDRGGSHHSLSVDADDGKLSPVNNPRRLKSVITVVYPPHDEGEDTWEKDSNKEEIVCDQDDYPSPKSFDSNEAILKVELDNQSHHTPNKGISQENADETDNQSKEAHTDNKEIGDLESILRQKALENLRKFRGRIQTDPKSSNVVANNENDENQLSDERVLDVQMEPANQSIPQDSDHVEKEHAMDQCAVSQADVAKNVSRSDTSLGAEATNACSASTAEPASSVAPIMEEPSLEGENEAKDGSQFEKKTMSVMRGGEMVQVSYKVYIPKKVPALARRQLKR